MGSFAADITAFVAKSGVRADLVLRKLALDGLRGVVQKTPVDTGRCRGSWRVSLNAVDATTASEQEFPKAADAYNGTAAGASLAAGSSDKAANAARGAQKSIDDGAPKIAAAKFGDSIYISNNLPYAPALEQGHSKQAPAGMLAVTFAELRASVGRAVASARSGAAATATPPGGVT